MHESVVTHYGAFIGPTKMLKTKAKVLKLILHDILI